MPERVLVLCVMVAFLCLASHHALAVNVQLDLVENGDGTLSESYTLNGITFSPSFQNLYAGIVNNMQHWQVPLPFTINLLAQTSFVTVEPEAGGKLNQIQVYKGISLLDVFSDVDQSSGTGSTLEASGTPFVVGTNQADPDQLLLVSFTDNAAAAETKGVPEAGGSLGLALLALSALLLMQAVGVCASGKEQSR